MKIAEIKTAEIEECLYNFWNIKVINLEIQIKILTVHILEKESVEKSCSNKLEAISLVLPGCWLLISVWKWTSWFRVLGPIVHFIFCIPMVAWPQCWRFEDRGQLKFYLILDISVFGELFSLSIVFDDFWKTFDWSILQLKNGLVGNPEKEESIK